MYYLNFGRAGADLAGRKTLNLLGYIKNTISRRFNIYAVSLDTKEGKSTWLDAIYKDHLNWTHVSDLKFWESAAAKLYGVNAIPFNVLIDNNGIIPSKFFLDKCE